MSQEIGVNPAITGVGIAQPEQVITNQYFVERGMDTSDQWIRDHTGVEERRFAEAGQHASDLATEAGKIAIESAGLTPADISGIIVATSTPDYLLTCTASIVHGKLGVSRYCESFDIGAACAGGAFAIKAASNEVSLRPHKRILAIGVDLISKIIDHDDRSTAILFGDGAGAVVIESREGALRPAFAGITEPDFDAMHIHAGGTVEPAQGPDDPRSKIHMDGGVVKKAGIEVMSELAIITAREAGLYDEEQSAIDWNQIDYFIPHQSNMYMSLDTAKIIGAPKAKCVITVNKHGNTSAAATPMALAETYYGGLMNPGKNTILISTVGTGFVGEALVMATDLRDVSSPAAA